MRKTVTKRNARINAGREMVEKLRDGRSGVDVRCRLIQMLVPVGLAWAEQEMKAEVEAVAGPRYRRGGEVDRWGWNPGSVYLGDQKVAVGVPRLRNRRSNEEIGLRSYEELQNPGFIDEMALRRVLKGLSQRSYEEAALTVPATFGIKKNSVSKRFIKASGRKLRDFLERDLGGYDIVALVLDGKTYAGTQVVVAMGVTMKGEKIILGFTEASTENYTICKEFLNRLINRGLKTDQNILVVLDGAKGLRKGVLEVFQEKAFIQRCQWHKRENVVRHLDREHQVYFRRKLQAAYEQPTYGKAKARLDVIRRELTPINESAVASLDEGLEETLTLHKLKMFTKIGISLKTTNCLENVNKQLDRRTGRVDRWRNSDQKRRWIASALCDIEPRLRLIKGREFLPTLRDMMHEHRFKSKFSRYFQEAA
jgi:putative transposase